MTENSYQDNSIGSIYYKARDEAKAFLQGKYAGEVAIAIDHITKCADRVGVPFIVAAEGIANEFYKERKPIARIITNAAVAEWVERSPGDEAQARKQVTTEDAAKHLLYLWLDGAFENHGDDDAIEVHEAGGDVQAILEVWLRRIANVPDPRDSREAERALAS